jgi:hypothetical protein
VSGPVVVLSPITAAQAVSVMSEAQKKTSSFVKPRATSIPPTTGPMTEPERPTPSAQPTPVDRDGGRISRCG